MAYLTTTDYYGFIASAIQPDRGKIDLYFLSLYKEHEQDNKVDFFDRLKNVILDLVEQFNKQKDQFIKGKEDMKEIQNDLLAKGQSFSKKTIDSFENLDWYKIHFYYYNGKIWSAEKQNSVQIYEFDILNLLYGIENFHSFLNKGKTISNYLKQGGIKIKWGGNMNQIFYIIRQIRNWEEKNDPIKLIENTNEELVDFLIENIICEKHGKNKFIPENRQNIKDQLNRKDTIPHSKRPDLSNIGKIE